MKNLFRLIVTIVLTQLPVAAIAAPLRIAFGSCAHQSRAQAHWKAIIDAKPDAFIFCGDNIYSDTYDMALMKKKYGQLAAHQGFQDLKKLCPVLAVWDDHDYGLNDSGGEFPKKKESREIFLDFWGVPPNAARRSHEGIYDATIFGPKGRRVQIILLDTRYNRSPLKQLVKRKPGEGRYTADRNGSSTILGEAQWLWLEEQLAKEADIRLIVSSIQVVAQDHNWEKWMNYPHERQRLYHLIHKTKATGVVFLSGDRHHGELCTSVPGIVGYPMYDLTASGLNMTHVGAGDEPNRHRIGPVVRQNNFGLITIDGSARDPVLTLELRTLDGKVALQQNVPLSKLKPAASP